MFDVLIKNGVIIDGTGAPKYLADVGIKENKIAKIGQLQNEKARVEIDASGLLVCPGFVDVNNHSDTYWQMFLNPNLESLIHQGITSIIGGNCGSSLAPLVNKNSIESIQKWVDLEKINLDWTNLKEFFACVENKELSINFGTLIGYGTLRRGIMKNQSEGATSKEKQIMENMLVSSMSEGAFGLSSGLVYVHTRSASFEELVDMARLIKKQNGIFVMHLRDERDEILKSVNEVIEIARRSLVKIHISHLKVMEKKNWSLIDEVLKILQKAMSDGIQITFDVYPYTYTGTVLHTLLPMWVTEGGRKMMLQRIRDLSIRPKIIAEMKKSSFDYSKIKIINYPIIKSLSKRDVGKSAMTQGRSAEEILLDIVLASAGHVIISADVLSEENIEKLISNPLSIVSSNGAGYNLEHAKLGEVVHPRSFGTFPRILHKYVLQRQLIGWEEAIKKMTSFPAERFGILKRGKIKEKYFADMTIIDRDKIQDLSTIENPYQYSRGIEYVLVNGNVVLDKGEYTGLRSGVVLKINQN